MMLISLTALKIFFIKILVRGLKAAMGFYLKEIKRAI